MEMTSLERQAMDFLLRGNNETLAILRAQLGASSVIRRELTGVGFFTHFDVLPVADKLPSPGRLTIHDVHATLAEIEYPVGFVLFVEAGAVDALEGLPTTISGPLRRQSRACTMSALCLPPQKGFFGPGQRLRSATSLVITARHNSPMKLPAKPPSKE